MESSEQSDQIGLNKWALLTEASVDLQLDIARILLNEHSFSLILVYRGNRSGTAQLLEFASQHKQQVMCMKMQEVFSVGGIQDMTARCNAIDLVITGYPGP